MAGAVCRRVLGDLRAAIAPLSAEQLTAASAAVGGSVGQHVRHILDHFEAPLGLGVSAPPVAAYDRRARDTPAERDLAVALRALDACEARIAALSEADMAAEVVAEHVDFEGGFYELPSSLQRELAFGAHHAIHHMAMIKLIAAEQGLGLPGDFGKAPATVLAGR